MSEIPQKLFYKVGEVCQYTDTQPYVLRFWESEFPALATEKNRNGQRVYRRQDIDLILRIKSLLYEEEYTIAEARKRLEEDVLAPASGTDGKKKGVTAPGRKSSAKPAKHAVAEDAPPPAEERHRHPEPERRPQIETEAYEPIHVRAPAAVEELLHRLEESDALLHSTREALHAEEQRRQECQQTKIAIAERLEALAERMKDRSS